MFSGERLKASWKCSYGCWSFVADCRFLRSSLLKYVVHITSEAMMLLVHTEVFRVSANKSNTWAMSVEQS
jgi:hypothetical protein